MCTNFRDCCPNYAAACAVPTSKKPNLIFVLVDDLGWGDVSWHSNPQDKAQMPVSEGLLKAGVELNRAYSYSWCGPARSSLLSGRLATHVMMNYTNEYYSKSNPSAVGNGIPAGMSTIGTKLKSAGYRTVYNGKWGAGYQGPGQMPLARGFDTYLGYFADSVDHYTMTRPPAAVNTPGGCEQAGFTDPYIVDFWLDHGPANALNSSGAWLDHMTLQKTLADIDQHDPSAPLLLFHAFASCHTPLDPPAGMLEEYASIQDYTRKAYVTMTSFVDSATGRIVGALKRKGMWENTFLVFSTDNGGPTYPGSNDKIDGGASNTPLKGSKTGSFEGGIRISSYVSGGLIPEKMRGKVLEDYIHISDWYTTFCALASVDPTDFTATQKGLPPVDGINQWPLLSGQVATNGREELYIATTILINKQWKLITGADVGNINQQQAKSPTLVPFNYYLNGYGEDILIQKVVFADGNLSSQAVPQEYRAMDCAQGCLFNIWADPSESTEVGAQYPDELARMIQRLQVLNTHAYDPYRGPIQVDLEQCGVQQQAGFYGDSSEVSQWQYQVLPG